MKTLKLVLILGMIFILAGCAKETIQEEKTTSPVATEPIATSPQSEVIASGGLANGYTVDIRLSDGTYDAVVRTAVREEKSRISLNDIFGQTDMTLSEGTLRPSYYNNDKNPDIAIGIEDSSGEYRYVILTVDGTGNIDTLAAQGYKEDGFIYTVNCGNYTEFTRLSPSGDNSLPGIAVGVKENDKFVPARYLWDGDKFVFKKENEDIIAQEDVPGEKQYSVKIVQTQFSQPLRPYDTGFTMYKAYILGEFDVVVTLDDAEISRLNVNDLFKGNEIGWVGAFEIQFDDYNNDGEYEFAIGQPPEDSPEFKYVLIGISDDGTLHQIAAKGYREDGYIYDAGGTPYFAKLSEPETGISVTVNNGSFVSGKYLWDETDRAFVFENK